MLVEVWGMNKLVKTLPLPGRQLFDEFYDPALLHTKCFFYTETKGCKYIKLLIIRGLFFFDKKIASQKLYKMYYLCVKNHLIFVPSLTMKHYELLFCYSLITNYNSLDTTATAFYNPMAERK